MGLSYQKHRTEIADNIDHEEYGAFLTAHSKVAAFCITSDRMAFRCLVQKLPDLAGRANDFIGGVCAE